MQRVWGEWSVSMILISKIARLFLIHLRKMKVVWEWWLLGWNCKYIVLCVLLWYRLQYIFLLYIARSNQYRVVQFRCSYLPKFINMILIIYVTLCSNPSAEYPPFPLYLLTISLPYSWFIIIVMFKMYTVQCTPIYLFIIFIRL